MDVTDSGGNYQMLADTGAYTYTVSAEGINNFTVSPAPATTSRTGYLFADTINFALTAIPGMNDFSVNLVPFTPVMPGVKASYRLICRNNGTVPLNARLKLIKMPTMILNSCSRLYDSLQVDTISWNYTNFRQLTTDTINLSFNVLPPPMVNINDTINTIAFVEIDSSQTNTMNDTTRLKQVARNAVDPNEKTERNAGSFSMLQLTNGDRLEYTIHFQNTGTYAANTVIVRDTLDEQLDWSTLKIIASGHAGNFILRNENKLEWKFDNINLPAAAFPEDTASMSFITYSVKPRSTVQIESVIRNKAAIYFDYNLPINTAEEQTIIYQSANAMRTYKFNGSGNWTNAANWFNGQIPPAILKIGDMVTITGACILDTIVHASAGSSITVATGGTLLIQGNLIMQ
jgi:fimbrial isopeptide formation D2 family protein